MNNQIIEFAQWYSGMARPKVEAAYKRYMKEKSLNWWNSIGFDEKFDRIVEWLMSKNQNTTSKHPDRLTDEDIQEIYELIK